MRALIVDGNNIAVRAYHVDNIYNFFAMVKKAIWDISPSHFVIVFDSEKDSWRKAEFPEYKADREKDEELSVALQQLKKSVSMAMIPTCETPEADDGIYTLASIALENKDAVCYILSGDTDLLQLVNNQVKVISFGRHFNERDVLDVRDVQQCYGMLPHQIPIAKALIGRHDNLPGLPGVGKKSAEKIIQALDPIAIDDVLFYAQDIAKIDGLRGAKSMAEKVEENAENLRLWYKLSCLRIVTVPFEEIPKAPPIRYFDHAIKYLQRARGDEDGN